MSHVDLLNSGSNSDSHSGSDLGSDSNDDTVTYDKPPTNFSQKNLNDQDSYDHNSNSNDRNSPEEKNQEPITQNNKNRTCSCTKLFIVAFTLALLFVLYGNYQNSLPGRNLINLPLKTIEVPKPVDWWNTYSNWCCVIPENLDNYGHRLYDCSANNRCLYYLSNWLHSQNLTTKSPLVKRCCYDVRAFGHPTLSTFCSLSCLNTVRT